MEKKRRMSREGFENLKAELEELINVQRVDVAQKLKEARSYGDLSENAEYDEAKNEQALLESRIAELKYIIENAEIVDDDSLNLDEVDIGMVVTLRKIGTDKIEQLKIVGTNEANFLEHKISDESPIGKAAMHKKVGDAFIVEAPAGEIKYEVLEISREIQKEA
ncbi:MAG: transcription elongation factor GreA [Oscillospiraceae bacterium]|nr:transcription elongation factor GreA [Oscillospiraceae bacterium]